MYISNIKSAPFIIVVVLLLFAGCKDNDNASKWAGIYAASAGAPGNTFSQIVVQENSSFSVRMFLDTVLPNQSAFSYTTLQNVTLTSASAGVINETDTILGFSHPLLITGTATLQGNSLTVSGTAINAYDTLAFYFNGSKL